MAAHATKRRKVNYLARSENEDRRGASDNGSASSTDDGGAVVVANKTSGIRHNSREGAKTRLDEMGQSASGAYNSTMFKLQMDELLVKVRPRSEKRMSKIENALRKLKSIIESIPSREAIPIPEAERAMKSHQIHIPFPEVHPGLEARYKLAYDRPININVVGSYARKTATEVDERLTVDLAVTMPSHIFQEKDFLNYRYFYKRAYYLACIAAGVQEANHCLPCQQHTGSINKFPSSEGCNFVINFAYQSDNPLQPIITIDPDLYAEHDDFTNTKCQIRVILAAKEDLFPISKTLPDIICIRLKSGNPSSSCTSDLPTPFHNATLRSECSSLPYLKLLNAASLRYDAFRDACLLGSIWLRQRGYGAGVTNGGFGQFEWACITALLMQSGGVKGRPILSSGYSSYQLFKAVLQFLSTRDLVLDPLFIQSNGLALVDNKKPVFFDGARGHNVLFKLTPWSYAMLRREASITLKALSQTLSDGFESSFIIRSDTLMQRFDSILNLSISPTWIPKSWDSDCIDRDQQFCQEAYNALLIALGDRVDVIYPIRSKCSAWAMALENISTTTEPSVAIGLLINPKQVNRVIDKGPSAEDKQAAAAFRKFWGDKAELRRFKDGSIIESLIWNSSSAENSILEQIVQYTIRRHLGPDIANGIKVMGENFGQLLSAPISGGPDSTLIYQPVMIAFETFEKDLRSLEGLPLQIRQISAAGPALRYASSNIPILRPGGPKMEPADVYVQFEGSARWPDDMSAVQRTKIAFLLKIGELLEDSIDGLTSQLGLENEKQIFLNIAFLDINYPTGAIFRLRIHHERELSLLERLLKDKSYGQGRREEIAHAASTYKRNFVQDPLHSQAVRDLSTRFPLLSPSMRLIKRWRDSHLLSPHIRDELIELLTIRTFLHPYPWQAPGSLRTAFLRTLTSISKWNWRFEPLIVDFKGELASEDIDAIILRFEAWRKIDPGMNRIVMFAASSLDPDGVTWTEQGPSKVVAARFTSLARAACEVVKTQGLDLEAQALFVPSYAEYDFLIQFNRKIVGQRSWPGKERLGFKNLELQSMDNDTLVAFDPTQLFLDELSAMYGSNVVFFYDAQKRSMIAGLWNPQTGPRPWKVNLSFSTLPFAQPEGQEAMISINKTAILNDIARLGGDMVSRVESLR